MFGRLYIEERGRPQRVIELQGAVTIGRSDDNDVVIDADGVSRCHAMLLAQPNGVMLLDLGSTFGTFVDTVQALPDEPIDLPDGAKITIGRAILRYAAPRSPSPGSANCVAISSNNGRAATARTQARPRLSTPYLNSRFEGLVPGEVFQVGRRASLLVWVGKPLLGDQRQSSRPLELPGLDLATPLALRVRVRPASLAWSVAAEEPVLLAAAWGSLRIARFQIVPNRPERTKLAIKVELADSEQREQHFMLGVLAVDPSRRAESLAARSPIQQTNTAWMVCRHCGAQIRASASFCPQCGQAR
jgi:FHA domain/zinc-ribbon domain